jgi:type III restriction enzyme/adenine-specific DNA-methyltransferase
LAVLKENFPACFEVDGSFDIERFNAEISSTSQTVQEGYELKFLGKSYAKLLASTESTTVIQPNENHNSLPENAKSDNIYISGDNLDGLKHLLKSYNGEINCIYIDPPYNTGSDGFVYFDNFNYNKETLQEKLSVSEEEAVRILDLTKRGSASHSAWLMFMYSRLLLARDLLKDDGVIFISIDDNEQANLKLLCDDVFGEENLIANVIWHNSSRASGNQISTVHEYLTIYGRNTSILDIWKIQRGGFEKVILEVKKLNKIEPAKAQAYLSDFIKKKLEEDEDEFKFLINYSNIDESGRIYYAVDLSGDGQGSPKKFGDIELEAPPGRHWMSQDYIDDLYRQNRIVWKGKRPYKVVYLDEAEERPQGIFRFPTRAGRHELKALLGTEPFNNPKPTGFMRRFLKMSTDKSSLVLDFFSGSATTAHALLQLNAEDDGNRKFISIQLPEILKEDNPAQKEAYDFLIENNKPTTLDYIGIERIIRAAAKIKQEHPDKALDLGFKHFILSEPNQNTLDKLDRFDKAGLLADTSILDDFGKPTILATWLNADGYGLAVNAENIDLAGYTAYYCQKHLYLINPSFTLESMKALLSKYETEGHFNPENLVLFGYSFPDWGINEMIEKNLRILNDGEKNLKINFTVRY